ncbi:hypothetical protein KEM60_02016 [Austwickia sp. TVS 96-490-7B]|uniref:hypothetical protein n=1 Tax=Austwickia sp. TVS 96-490-7B TaxID=2830843 RepID=UPI001C576B4F|nr:hypothetical protein [Austwickia sp. TVS 96-490-7B]MBW3085805.1 hypothetical protein [Austwickia sp. TVS 96-490-7B]
MVALILFILFVLVTFGTGCFIVGSVIVDARREGRHVLPAHNRARLAAARVRTDAATVRARQRSAALATSARELGDPHGEPAKI